jgi:isoaspartyl peptidase/L-asparaginase-like protein (Ntn-hydrolase superfamily)
MANRRKFFKLGLGLTALGFIKPVRANEILGQSSDKKVVQPTIISTWNHGIVANKAGFNKLKAGLSALDAVEAGARITESDVENRSVGVGGNPDELGKVTLDACIMNEKSQCGAVAFVQNIEHPISVARKVMEDTPHVMLVGKGAEKFAKEKGFPTKKMLSKGAKEAYKNWKKDQKREKPAINHENHDTIGLLAIDQFGNISGACTTSGWAYKLHGRVGDSPIIGAGLFVDNEIGGAVATGMGEAVIRIAGSHTVVELMRNGKSPQEACKEAVERILEKHEDHTNLQVGFLAINKFGEVGAYSVYNGFNYAIQTESRADLVDAEYNRKW